MVERAGTTPDYDIRLISTMRTHSHRLQGGHIATVSGIYGDGVIATLYTHGIFHQGEMLLLKTMQENKTNYSPRT